MTTESGSTQAAVDTLERLRWTASLEEALEFFDSLPPATVDQVLGDWHGSGLETGNPLDGLLEAMSWHGKRFRSPDDVDPLVMEGKGDQFCVNPRFAPLGAAIKWHTLLRVSVVQRIVRRFLPLLRTTKPAARLRMVEYRGVVTATMSYDALPVNDHFRLIDKNTLLGAMDLRGMDAPFMFILHREAVAR
ncbi:DUF4334 domain-containing protein [Rhodococcus sp. NPDC003382]